LRRENGGGRRKTTAEGRRRTAEAGEQQPSKGVRLRVKEAMAHSRPSHLHRRLPVLSRSPHPDLRRPRW